MKQFNTHGGYFAPLGYTRINEGGSHDENPYGGVQVGVDNNGVPDMVQEDESIYDDFVFSNTIKADKKFLKDNKIADKYSGKLYSEIVDSIMDEAKERPLDSVSNNGLRVMLSRLANAQESQKQFEEEKAIEKEIANLSPEELAQLEKILAAEQGIEAQPVVPQGIQIPEEQIAQISPEQQAAMMACGGPIRRHDTGGGVSYGGMIAPAVVEDYHPFTQSIIDSRGKFLRGVKDVYDTAKFPLYFIPGINGAVMASDVIDGVVNRDAGQITLAALPGISKIKSLGAGIKSGITAGIKARKAAMKSSGAASSVSNTGRQIASRVAKNAEVEAAMEQAYAKSGKTSRGIGDMIVNSKWSYLSPTGLMLKRWKPTTTVGKIAKGSAMATGDTGAWMYGIIPGYQYVRDEYFTDPFEGIDQDPTVQYELDFSIPEEMDFRCGGNMKRRHDDGGKLRMLPIAASAIKGLYNSFQKPDEYKIPAYRPTLPTGELNLENPSFSPIDMSIATNNALAGHAATMRALRNSGNMISSPASVIAADNNLYGNIGTTLSDIANMNNQMRNNIIAQRNANAKALADFNLGLSSQRAQILNDAAQRNIQNNLLLQRLNYAAEGEKYAAIGNEIDKVTQGLSGIGTENIRMNMANGMFDYVMLPDGKMSYVPKIMSGEPETELIEEQEKQVNSGKRGGTLLRKCK